MSHKLASALRKLAVGRDVVFGSQLAIHVDDSAAYEGTNPRTGERVVVASRRLPSFIFADAWKP